MKNEPSSCCSDKPRRIETISGAEIDIDTIREILGNHPDVRDASLEVVEDGRGGSLLDATVVLEPGLSPSDELKLELAWHVGIESGHFSIFRDISFTGTGRDEALIAEREEGLTGTVTISGHEIRTSEVERVLESCTGVVRARVIGVPDTRKGHVLKAFVSLAADVHPSEDLMNELAWQASIGVGPMIAFREIEFVPRGSGTEGNDLAHGLVHRQVHGSGHGHVHGQVSTPGIEVTVTGKGAGTVPGQGKIIPAPKGRPTPGQGGVAPGTGGHSTPGKGRASSGTGEKDGGSGSEGSAHSTPDGMLIVDGIREDGGSFRISGHRISTTEITRSLLTHPYIRDAAVVTVPDDRYGETMKAFVKLREGVTPSNDLKLELAWHVMTELKPVSVFRNIDLGTEPSPASDGAVPAPAPDFHPAATVPVMAPPPEVPVSVPEVPPAASVPVMAIPSVAPDSAADPHSPPHSAGIAAGCPPDGVSHRTGETAERVERILSDHPVVSEAIVVGVKDEVHGQALQAFVTLREGYHPSEDLMTDLAWTARTELDEDIVFRSIRFRQFFPESLPRADLISLLKADAMDVPAMFTITIAD